MSLKNKNTPVTSQKPVHTTQIRPQWIWWLPVLLSFALYANTLGHGFVLDDSLVITKNKFTTQGISGLGKIFSTDTFFGYYQEEGRETLITGGRYRPLSLAFFAILFQVFGANPLVFHFFNMLLYAICGYLILKVLLQLENQTSRKGWALPATLLFMAHPVHTEVVANIKCADEILSLLLSLLTLRFTLMAWETGNGAWKWKAGLAFLAACFAKENAVTWLAVIPLTIWMFYDTPWEVFRKKVATLLWMPLLAACIFILVRGGVLHWTFGKEADVLINNPFIKWDGAHWIPFSWAERSAAILFSLGKYFQLLIFPHPLTHDYYPRQIGMPGWGDWQVWFSAILLVALAVWSLMGIRTRKFSAFTILYYGITLSVVSNIFFPVGTNLSERFVFMPSLGFCMLAGWGLSQIKAEKTRWIVLVLVLLLYSVKTTLRNTVWKDNITLATADIGTSANSAKLNNSLAAQLTERALKLSQPGERKAQTDKAIGYFTRAIEINPAYIEALYGRGSAWFVQGNSFNALKDFLAAEQISAAYPNLRNNLALAFRESAKTLIQNNGDRAIILAYLKEAQKRFPSDPEINTLLAQFSQ